MGKKQESKTEFPFTEALDRRAAIRKFELEHAGNFNFGKMCPKCKTYNYSAEEGHCRNCGYRRQF